MTPYKSVTPLFTFQVHDMLGDNDYIDYLYSFTNGFEINRRLIIPLIRVHAPSLVVHDNNRKESFEDEEEVDHMCDEQTTSSRPFIPTRSDESSNSLERPSIHHERDCYLMPYSYKDIETMYTMLPRNRSKSLSHTILYPPSPCEQCRRFLNVPDLDALHRNKKQHGADNDGEIHDGDLSFKNTTNSNGNDILTDYLYTSGTRDVVLTEDEDVTTNCCERFRKRSSSLSDLRTLHL